MFTQDSFEKLVEEFTPMIHHIIKSLHIYKDTDEYFQLGLIALWEASNKFDEEKGKLSSIAYAKIRGKLLDHLRSEANKHKQHMLSNSSLIFENIEGTQASPFTIETINSYCTGLSTKELKWVHDTFIYQKTLSEIAKEENVSTETVKTWRKRALKKLRNNNILV